ncbi:MAG: hypothetical protein ACI9R3_005537 [Verrucomicrobiales bacterium]|jgi:hypothetical protein
MQAKTPFLNRFPTRLFGKAKRSAQEVLKQQRKQLHENNVSEISAQFSGEITPELIQRHSSTKRTRIYSHAVTFWAFFTQVFSEDASCAKAVARVQQWCRQLKLPAPSANTTSFVDARQRLPEAMLQGIHQGLLSKFARHGSNDDLWRGHVIKAVDATSAQMPDTARNQAKYPQPSRQAAGCGFPVVQLIGVINLINGAWEEFVESDLRVHEHRGFELLYRYIAENEILAADRAYTSYELIARLMAQKSHLIGRHHPTRKLDFRKGKKLGPNERLQKWTKPAVQPRGSCLSKEPWEQLPEEIEVRIIRVKGPDRTGKTTTKYLVTTLLDPVQYPAEEIGSLYCHRWEIELRFRDIKTTMRMEMLRTKSPEMIRKEIMMHMIAYNALRLLMLKAGKQHGRNYRRVSFKGALQVIFSSIGGFVGVWKKPLIRQRERDNLLRRIAERVVPDRPGRNEPRKLKRRTKILRMDTTTASPLPPMVWKTLQGKFALLLC